MQKYKNKENKDLAFSKLKLGIEKIKEISEAKKEEYLKDMKKCKNCENFIPFEKRNNTFCSSSCSAIFNNSNKKKKIRSYCRECNSPIYKRNNVFCNTACFSKNSLKTKNNDAEKMKKYIAGELNDEQVRRFFRKITEKRCSICGIEEWMGKEVPLEVDHIDGNYKNNFPENLRFICRNCGAQLDTYGSRNYGKGREDRYK